jgi:multiple sugar transport system substrate-binding protein
LVLVGTIAFVMARLGIGSNLGQGALTQSVSLESSTYTPTHLSPTNTFETTMTAIPTPPVVPTLTPMVKPLSPEKVTVTWYVGLGTGVQTEQMVSEKAVVDKFNKSQDKIELKVVFADNTTIGADTLNKLISAGRIPDIVGPMGMLGSNYFENEWLDLQPLVDKTQYTIPDFPSNLIKVYQQGGGLYGIPFAVYPGLFYYNKDLFDKADLAYPPINFGDKYVLDGKSVDWNWDTVATIAKKLTLDSKDNDANSDKFDPTKVVQFGFIHQWDPIRSQLSTFGGASVLNSQSGNVQIPDNWRAGAKWLWNGIWKEHFIPSQSYQNGELLNSNAFATGKIAMARTMLWYTCCLSELKAKWDLAPVPAYNGQYYAPADADTFRIDKRTKHPDEAFAVLLYLLDTAAPDLLPVYGAYPARPDLQDKFLKDLAIRFPTVKNWSIVLPSLDYIVLPHNESYFPNFAQVQSRFTDFESLLYGDSGGYINIDQEVDKLQFDLQSLMKTTD